jgi:hypothetical protein
MLNYNTFLGRQGQAFVYERTKTGLMFFQLTLATINFIFPFNTFNIHSLILFNRSLLLFEMMAFLNLGYAVLSTCKCDNWIVSLLLAQVVGRKNMTGFSSGNMWVRKRSL